MNVVHSRHDADVACSGLAPHTGKIIKNRLRVPQRGENSPFPSLHCCYIVWIN